MIRKWKDNYKDKSIQHVILSTFTCVSVISFLILAIIFTHYVKGILEDFIQEENAQQIEVLAEGVEREFRQAVDFFDTVHYKIIKKDFSKKENFETMMDFICEENRNSINDLIIFEEFGDVLYENHNADPMELTMDQKKKLYKNGCTDVGKTWFTQIPQSKDILVYRIVELENNGIIKSVVLAGTLKYEKIISGFRAHDAKDGNYFYMQTKEGKLFYHPKAIQMEHNIYKEKLGPNSRSEEDGSFIKVLDHKQYFIHQYTMGYTGWKIIGVSSLDDIIYKNYPVGFLIWSLFLVVGLVAVGINRYIVKKITGPLQNLSSQVEQFGSLYDPSKTTKIDGTYEIRKLSESFLQMQQRIRHLMTKEVQKEHEYWSMQMRLLQSQINPHFLYNTLDSIIWMIQSKRYDGAAKMVSSLAGFFRISLNKGGDFITIDKEVLHVKNYMEIQGIRFEDKFSFQIQCDESIKNCMCPKLIIQPLAENAVYHGMEGMYGDGEIEIKAYEKEGLIYIDVSDNGEGMSQEQIQQMMYGTVVSSKRGSGIGVRNVNERLKYCFGNQYGITIFSEIDEGTVARICIPKVEDLNEYWKKEKNFLGGSSPSSLSPGNVDMGTSENKDHSSFCSPSGRIPDQPSGLDQGNQGLQ